LHFQILVNNTSLVVCPLRQDDFIKKLSWRIFLTNGILPSCPTLKYKKLSWRIFLTNGILPSCPTLKYKKKGWRIFLTNGILPTCPTSIINKDFRKSKNPDTI
jgi:sRNA-binding regulator protein Hfq